MADTASSTSTAPSATPLSTSNPFIPTPTKPLISISAAQLPLKLTKQNYLTWRHHIQSLLIGYDLQFYVDENTLIPPPTIHVDSHETQNPVYHHWYRQDQLILNGLLASISPPLQPLLASVTTAAEAWSKITLRLANRSRSRIMALKERLMSTIKGDKPMDDYLQQMKSYADELALTDTYIDDDELALHILKGLGSDYQSTSQVLRGRDTPISFEELSLKLGEAEEHLKRQTISLEPVIPTVNYTRHKPKTSPSHSSSRPPSSQSRPPSQKPLNTPTTPSSRPRIQCQICDKIGHSAKQCRRGRKYFDENPIVHYTSVSQPTTSSPPTWYLDSCASAHVTADLNNLNIHSDYDGPEEVVVGDGTGLTISHSGSTQLHTPTKSFALHNVLCVPQINKNLISVSHFCKHNHVSVEFFPNYFLVKDLRTGATLTRGQNRNDVYVFPGCSSSSSTPPLALSTTKVASPNWHSRLGHPSHTVLRYLFQHNPSFQNCATTNFICESCKCSKSHRLPFDETSMTSNKPLQLLYSDIWGPAPAISLDGCSYYVIFIDHFTKYTWFFTM